ncbi:hypothetical protein GOODEAATRI_020938 [Goodea atripinnis]|uniref:Uncharacterized protein n=1 Tax=Goodea atripinnis TaxID=208336 RepID=A0ABV0NWF0_9TELE
MPITCISRALQIPCSSGNMLPYEQGMSFRPQSGCISPLPRSVSVGTQTVFPHYLTTDGYDGIYGCSSTTRSTEDAPVPAVDPLSLVVCIASPQQKANDNHCLYVGSQPLAGTRIAVPGFANRESNLFARWYPWMPP